MKSSKSLIGMPVIAGGSRLGSVAQVQLSDSLDRMTGLWVDCGLKGTRYLKEDEVLVLGEVAVIVGGTGKRAKVNGEAMLKRALSTDGQRVGAILDAVIDEQTRKVEALELSRGYLDDLVEGRERVSSFTVQPGTGDVVLQAGNEPPERRNLG